ncbi:MAG TPA: 3-dehydroquinate synthase [Chromatiales bacterium]|nr:3-dehydroquinate synthase [Thiotrichales bacterium]HIP68774.1 3-dehydroquinate synthase [Chromatiales bacterium]
MDTLKVDLGERSYPIYIGSGLLNQTELLTQHIQGQSALVVSNETIAPLYLNKLLPALEKFKSATCILPDGEQYKNLEVLNQIYTNLLEQHFDRKTTLIALGGGVVGDMTGFAAASYQRGINFIQIPTTLLAMVDSSVGGKTGVNHPLGKNMIGAFHQPQCVIIDTDTLDTLDDRELSAGLAEVIKYGLINDPDFFAWLEENMDKLLQRDKDALAYAIRRSCENKAAIVAADEREQGMRALLNLGHTFGHAIETGMGYGNWLHGEAVACGMMMAAEMSHRLGWINADKVEDVRKLLQKAKLPTKPPEQMIASDFLQLMAVDKKVIDGNLRLVLLKDIGKALVTADFSNEALSNTLQHCLAA